MPRPALSRVRRGRHHGAAHRRRRRGSRVRSAEDLLRKTPGFFKNATRASSRPGRHAPVRAAHFGGRTSTWTRCSRTSASWSSRRSNPRSCCGASHR
jgi:hypothetical protein